MSSSTTPVMDREPGARGRTGVVARKDLQRAVLRVACGPLLAGLAGAAFLLLVIVVLAPESDLTVSRVLRATGAAWLAAYQVPLEIEGAPLGVLPLLPTVVVMLLVARIANRAAAQAGLAEPGDAMLLAVAAGGGHAVFGCLVATVISTPGTPDVSAAPLGAAAGCGIVTGLAVLAGLAGPCGLVRAGSRRVPGWALHGLAAAGRGTAVLATAGLGAVLVGLVVSAGTVRDLFTAGAPDAGSAMGLALLSTAYLPNAGVWGGAWLAGPGISLGGLSSSPFDTTGSGIPAVPLLGALPLGAAPAWWLLFLLVPLAAGVVVGRRVRLLPDLPNRIRAVLLACAAAGVCCAVVAAVSGGRLGTGAFDPVEVPTGELFLACTGWFLLAALPIAWWGERSMHPRRLVEAITLPRPRRVSEAPASVADAVVAARSIRYGALAGAEADDAGEPDLRAAPEPDVDEHTADGGSDGTPPH